MVTYPDSEKHGCYLNNSEIYKKIGEIAKYRRGSFPQPYDNPEWYGGVGAMPFVQVADISDNMILNKKTNKTISVKAQPKSVFVPKGTVVISLQGSIGRVAITQYDSYIDRTVAVFQDLANNVDKKYFLYQLHRVFSEEKKAARGSTIKTITKEEFTEFQLPLPEKAEQEEIACTLSQFDTYIDDLAELIEKKKGIRDGALEDLISGKARIVGFSGERKEYSINDITCEVITGGTPSTSRREYYGGNIPWLASTEIHQKRITKPTTYITELGLQNSSAKIAPEKSVLIALAGQGKTRGTAAYLTKPMALNQSLAALVTNEKCNSEFLYYLVESMYSSLRELSSGDGGRGGLNKKLIKGVLVKIPIDVDEQEAIANILFAMDEEIRDLETEREKIIQIREGAMDDLLTGRVRLTK